MRKITFVLLGLILGFNVLAQENGYEISVEIKGLKAGDSLLLANYFGDQVLRRDTAIVNDKGTATFVGNEKLNRGVYLVSTWNFRTFDFVMPDDQKFSLKTDSTDNKFIKSMKVEGSEENQVFFDYLNYLDAKGKIRNSLFAQIKAAGKDSNKIRPLEEEMAALNDEVMAYQETLYEKYDNHVFIRILNAQREPEIPKDITSDSLKFVYYKKHYWDKVDFSEEGLVRAPNALLKKKIDKYFDRLVYMDPDSIKKECDILIKKASNDRELDRYIIWYLGNKYQSKKIMCMDDVYIHILNKYYCEGKRAWWVDSAKLAKMCEEAHNASFTPCNGVAPDMKNLDTADVGHRLHSIESKFTIVLFWDPTCGHCKKVVPLLDSLYDANKDKDWTIYAISSQNKYNEWREYIRTHPGIHDWINVCKPSRENWPIWHNKRIEYNNISNPTIYILDKDKKIRAKKISENKVAEFLNHLETISGGTPVIDPRAKKNTSADTNKGKGSEEIKSIKGDRK